MLFRSAKPEWLIVGLGNPGRDYAMTRHNVGFRAVDALAASLGVKVDRLKFNAYTAAATVSDRRVLLIKPTTFMNNSGQAVRQAARYYAIEPAHILVLSDDISLSPGRIRVRGQGSAGGHNGLKSIIAELGSQDFPRVKIGVGEKPHPDYDLADWVLSRFSAQEEKLVSEAIERAAQAAELLLRDGVEAAAAKFNGKA